MILTMKKIFLIVLDGLGDRPNVELQGRTALQAAYRPNLNRLVKDGQCGIMHPVSPGYRTGSDTSHLSLLGYDPEKFYTGRGPFEAMGLGMTVLGGDVAFRANFGTVDTNGVVTDRRAGRITSGTDKLAEALSFSVDGVDFFVRAGVEHRAALVMRGKDLMDRITDSDPHEPGLRVQEVKPLDEKAKFTADVLNKYLALARKKLADHPLNAKRIKEGKEPANELLIRGAGQAPSLTPFSELYGMKAACISGIPMITGICRLIGMDSIAVEGATGRLDSDFRAKFEAAYRTLNDYDFLIMNIKATDVAGHDGEAHIHNLYRVSLASCKVNEPSVRNKVNGIPVFKLVPVNGFSHRPFLQRLRLKFFHRNFIVEVSRVCQYEVFLGHKQVCVRYNILHSCCSNN